MASFAPAACSRCAIAHAMLRLLATPNTTAVRPCIAFDILITLAELKRISNALDYTRASSAARSVAGVASASSGAGGFPTGQMEVTNDVAKTAAIMAKAAVRL